MVWCQTRCLTQAWPHTQSVSGDTGTVGLHNPGLAPTLLCRSGDSYLQHIAQQTGVSLSVLGRGSITAER